ALPTAVAAIRSGVSEPAPDPATTHCRRLYDGRISQPAAQPQSHATKPASAAAAARTTAAAVCRPHRQPGTTGRGAPEPTGLAGRGSAVPSYQRRTVAMVRRTG